MHRKERAIAILHAVREMLHELVKDMLSERSSLKPVAKGIETGKSGVFLVG